MSGSHDSTQGDTFRPPASATFSLGDDGANGPSPLRKSGLRGRSSLGGSKTSQRPTASEESSAGLVQASSSSGEGADSRESASLAADGLEARVKRVPGLNLNFIHKGGAGAFPPAFKPQEGPQTADGGNETHTFTVGPAGGPVSSHRTPRGGRARSYRAKPTNVTPAAGTSATAADGSLPFSPIAMTPMDDLTYLKSWTASVGAPTPMEITPQVSNIFQPSPLGSIGEQGAGNIGQRSQGGAEPSQGASASPAPFKGFPQAAVENAPSPLAPLGLRSNGPAGATSAGPINQSAAQPGAAAASAVTCSSAGETASASGVPAAVGTGATAGAGSAAAPTQCAFPGAKVVHDLFGGDRAKVLNSLYGQTAMQGSSRTGSSTARGPPSYNGPAGTGTFQPNLGSMSARGPTPSYAFFPPSSVTGAATAQTGAASGAGPHAACQPPGTGAGLSFSGMKKVPESGMATGAGASDGAGGGAAGNDCQPTKDNGPKGARGFADSGSAGSTAPSSGPSTGNAPSPAGAVPEQASPPASSGSSSSTTSPTSIPGGSDAFKRSSAAGASAIDAAAAAARLLAERLEKLAATARKASTDVNSIPTTVTDAVRAALAEPLSFTDKEALHLMLRPELLDPRAAPSPPTGTASDGSPGVTASLTDLLNRLHMDEKQAADGERWRTPHEAPAGDQARSSHNDCRVQPSTAHAAAPEPAAPASTAPAATPTSSSATAAPAAAFASVPFVFGVTSNGGGSGSAGSSAGGNATVGSSSSSAAPPNAAVLGGNKGFGAAAPAEPSKPEPVVTGPQAHVPQAVPFVFVGPQAGPQGGAGVSAFTSAAAAGGVSGPTAAQTATAAAAPAAAAAANGTQPNAGVDPLFPGGGPAPTASRAGASRDVSRPSSGGSSSATAPPVWSFTFGATATPPPPPEPPITAATTPAFSGQQPTQSGVSAAASGAPASSFGGASPMSWTPVSNQQQPPQPGASSSTQGRGVGSQGAPSVTMGVGSLRFDLGSSGGGAEATSGVTGAASSTGFTPGRKSRAKVTPRKSRGAEGSGSRANSAGGVGSTPTSAGASAAQTDVSMGQSRASHAAPPTSQPQPQQPHGQQPQAAPPDGGVDSAAVQAIRLKQSADERKRYGNQKYEQSDFASAEQWYTAAIDHLENQMQLLGLSHSKLHQLFPSLKTEIAVLYSNRSGARLMTAKPKSALEDAQRAMALDPTFQRGATRAATCHCRLGDFEAAETTIADALKRCPATSPQYQDLMKKYEEVINLKARAAAATNTAVAAGRTGNKDKLQDALSQLNGIKDQVAYCEVMAAARAAVALRLGLCRDAMTWTAPHPEVPLAQRAAAWRVWIIVQAMYFRGDLQEAMTKCRELRDMVRASPDLAFTAAQPDGSASAVTEYKISTHVKVPTAEMLEALAEDIKQQWDLKEEGNAAIKAGRHADAVDRYTRALAKGCCPAFAAVLHGNRAAAHQGMGQLADAMADCSRARALDPSYYRASSRLAALMLEIRRPENAVGLLEPVLKLSAQSDGSGPTPEELSKYKAQLSEARAAIPWMKTPHHYKVLGLESTCSDEDVRKSYRKLALKFHPDKAMAAVRVSLALAGQAGDHPYSGQLALSAEVEARVQKQASWLFNFINQANEELSDKTRRRKVDQLLDAEHPPASRYGNPSAAANPYGSGFYPGARYSGYGGAYYDFNNFYQRSSAAGGSGAGASSRARTATGGGAAGGSYGGYGGYGSYGGSRPGGARPAAPPGAGAAGNSSRGSGAGAGASRPGAAGGAGFGGYARGGGGGAARQPQAGKKWWESGTEESDEDDQETFNF